MNLEIRNYLSLVIWVVSLVLVGSLIGSLTKSDVDIWYETLNRSPLTPPNYLFGIVWSILYVMIGVSGWLIWKSENFSNLKLIKNLYILQLILNWSWTPIFFTYHLTGLALICMFIIAICLVVIIVKSYSKMAWVSFLLIPYLLWLLFASHLNFYIWQYN